MAIAFALAVSTGVVITLRLSPERLGKLTALAIVLSVLVVVVFACSQALFTLCSELYERLPFIITTNLKFADWVQVFGDERLTTALLDRITHHAYVIELIGESYCFRQRLVQQ